MISEMLGAIAYIAIAFVANDLFVATEMEGMGRRRSVIMAVVSAGVAVQIAMMITSFYGPAELTPGLNVLAAGCLMALPLNFWPVAARFRHGRIRVVNRRLTERAQRAEVNAASSRKWLALAEQSGHVGHWQLTVPENRLVWSDEIYRIHGLWREHYRPRIETALAAFHPLDGKHVEALLKEAVTEGSPFEVTARLRRPDGEIRHVVLRAVPHLDALGSVEALDGVMVDVTEPKRAEMRLPWMGSRELPLEDSLTGLVDRAQFDLSLGYEFKRAVRSRKPLGMVLLDIDHFRLVAEHYGVLEGDVCLRAVAQAVQAMPWRTGDVVARYGETEIAVLLPLADAAGALRVAAKIAEAVRTLGLLNAGHHSGLLSVSCGAAAFIGLDDLYNPLELTRRASRALADARASGRNRICGFDAMEFLETLAERV